MCIILVTRLRAYLFVTLEFYTKLANVWEPCSAVRMLELSAHSGGKTRVDVNTTTTQRRRVCVYLGYMNMCTHTLAHTQGELSEKHDQECLTLIKTRTNNDVDDVDVRCSQHIETLELFYQLPENAWLTEINDSPPDGMREN